MWVLRFKELRIWSFAGEERGGGRGGKGGVGGKGGGGKDGLLVRVFNCLMVPRILGVSGFKDFGFGTLTL